MTRSLLCAATLLATIPLAAQPVALDPDFGVGGVAALSVGTTSVARDAVLMPDGGLLLIGTVNGSAGAARIDADGSLDTAFGTAGSLRFAFSGRSSFLSDVKRLSAGGYVVSGVVATPDGARADYSFVARFSEAGVLDPSFGDGGVVRVSEADGVENVLLAFLEPLPDEALAVVGSGVRADDGRRAAVSLRLLSDGTRDPGYGEEGAVRVDKQVAINDGRRLSDGRVVAVGSDFTDDPDGDGTLLRLQPDGALDPTFGDGGALQVPLSGDSDTFFRLALDAAGQVLAAGYSGRPSAEAEEALVARVTLDGELDSEFGTLGLTQSEAIPDAQGSDVVLRADGRILLSGFRGTPSQPFLAQFLTSGAPDLEFGSQGVLELDLGARRAVPLSIKADGDGHLFLIGYSQVAGGEMQMLVLRLVEQPVAGEAGPGATGLSLAYAGRHPAAEVRLAVDLDAPATLRVDLVDAVGRTVATFHDGPLGAGRHGLRGGGDLPPGVYFARAVADDGRTATRPVVVAR